LSALTQNGFIEWPFDFRSQIFDGASSGSLRIIQVFSPSLDFADPELDTPK
jgi:hypothetical protein